jgi:hypothetical protein
VFEELRSRRQVELLESQLQQAEERLRRQEEHIAVLEQEHISREKNWEKAQLMWEQTQVCNDFGGFVCFSLTHSEMQRTDTPLVNSGTNFIVYFVPSLT